MTDAFDTPREGPEAAKGLITYMFDVEGVSMPNAVALVDSLIASYLEGLQARALRGDLDLAMERVRALQERYPS